MMITISLLIIFIILLYNYYVHFGKNGRLINRIPGPPGYPIAGNILQYLGSRGKLKLRINLYNLNICCRIRVCKSNTCKFFTPRYITINIVEYLIII